MDFKNILSQLSQISEATKETGKGRIHTAEPGGYGRKDDEDDEGKKIKADAPKKGRGRPKKDSDETGEKKTYDTKSLGDVFGGGKKPKKEIGKVSKKHSLKEWVEEIENKYVAEAGAPGQALQVKPMPGASQLVDPATQKVIATGPADKIKAMQGSIAKGEVTMTGKQEMAEEDDYSAKKARAGKDIGKPGKAFAQIAKSAGERYGSKERGEKVAGAVLAKLRKKTNEGDIPSDQADFGAGLGAGRSQATFEGKKPDFPDIDDDGNRKESIAKAAQDAKKGKQKVKESMDTRLKAAHLRGKAHAMAKEGYNCRYEDIEETRMYHEGYKEGLDECYGQVPIRGTVVGEEVPATVPGMADQAEGLDEMDMYEMDKTEYMKHKAKTTPGGTFKAFGQTMHDKDVLETSMFESWDKELDSLLTEYDTIQEGMTVSISKGQQGAPDSVSVTAQDQEADQLLQVIKQAGLGLFGGDEPAQTTSSMSLQPADGGAEGQDDIGVVDDHDGMMALIKKVTGGAGEPEMVAIGGDDHGHDYEDEEGDECDTCGHADCECDHEEDKEKIDEVESEDQMAYEVAEANAPDSGAEETAQEVADTAQANQSAAEYDPADDLDESEKLDEWANEAGQKGTDAQFETDIAFMTKVIAGGLNKEKATGQTTIPVIPGQNDRMGYSGSINESIGDWKKLAGIK